MPDDLGQPENPAPVVETADVTPPVEAPSTPAEAAPDATTPTPPPPADESARPKVASVSDYEKRLAEMTSGMPDAAPTPGTPAEEPAPAEPETPPPAEPAPEPPPAPPETPKGEFRPRLKALDARKQEAVLLANSLATEGKPISLAEAERRIDAKYGIEPAAPAAAPDPNAPQPRTLEAVTAEIEAAEKTRRDAIRQLDPDTQFEAEDKIRQLQQEAGELQSKVKQETVSQQTAFEQAVSASHELTAKVYPAYADPNHPIHAVADRIYDTKVKLNDPQVTEPDCPFKVYQMAANELGIAPLDPEAPAAPATKSPTLATPKPQLVHRTAVVRPPSAVTLAPASARTTQPGPPKPAFGKIRTPADYEAVVEQLAR